MLITGHPDIVTDAEETLAKRTGRGNLIHVEFDETCWLIAVILDFEETDRVKVISDVEEWLQLEVGPLHFTALLVVCPVAIVVFGKTKLTEHPGIALALSLLLLRQFSNFGTLQCVHPLPPVLVGGDQCAEVAVLQVLIPDHHEQRADVADSLQSILGSQFLNILRTCPVSAAAVPENKFLLTHLREVSLVNDPRVRILLFGSRIINRYLPDIDRETDLQCSSAIGKDIGCTCRELITRLKFIGIGDECHSLADAVELLQLVFGPRTTE